VRQAPTALHPGLAVNRPPAQACIFDMDGLLVDSEPIWQAAHIAVLAELGVDVRPFVGSGLTTGMRVDEVIALWRSHQPWDGPSDAEVADRIVAAVAAAIRQSAVLLPGAREALDYCAGFGLVLALATGSTPPVVHAVLDRFDLRGRFAAVCSAEQDTHGKPHPAIFLRTAELLGLAPARCVVLEDSINGVIAAKAARMRVVAVPPAELAGDPRYAIADVQLKSLEEIGSPEVAELLGLAMG
jgi:sugar-phosphatase